MTLSNALLPYYYRWNSGAGFVQNDWKIKPNLTLNIGLRYALQLPRTEKYNHQGTFPARGCTVCPASGPLYSSERHSPHLRAGSTLCIDGYGGRSSYLWPADYTDFEPRFGFAWSPKLFGWNGQGRFVIRGGYGLSHSPLNGQNRQPLPSFSSPATGFGVNSGQVNPAYAMRLSSNPPDDPPLSWSQVLTVPSNGLITLNSLNYSGSGFAISQNMKTPYSQNWNLTLAYQIDNKDAIEIAYAGNKGTHLFLPIQTTIPPA